MERGRVTVWGLASVLAASVIAAGAWWAHAANAPVAVMPLVPPVAMAPTAPPLSATTRTAVAPPAQAPSGLSAEQWRDLQTALKDHPKRDAEIARIAGFIGYQGRLERYRALRRQDAAGLIAARELAGPLLAELPAHVAQGEVGGSEALQLQTALIATLAPNPAARDTLQADALRRLQAAEPPSPAAVANAERNARFLAAQSALLAQWNERPPAQRDSAQLNASLQALRESVFDAGESSAAPTPSTAGATR